MTCIIDEIDRNLLTMNVNAKAYGLCIPVIKGTQVHPVSVSDYKQVAINDRYDVQWFHRLMNDTVNPDEEFSFGATYKRRHLQIIRTVLIVKKKMGFDFVYDFINKYPSLLRTSAILTDYKFVNLTEPGTVNSEQDVIYKTEFGPDHEQYEKHRIPYIINALEFGVDYIKCLVPCT